VIGRLLAVEQLGNKKNKEAVAKLKQALNNDSSYGVRIEAARALRLIHSEEALSALINSTNQPDARVRQQAYASIGDFYDPHSRDSERAMLTREKNPDIQTIAVRDLGGYPKADRETLLQYLNSTSYRNTLAEAAIGAIRAQNDPSWIEPLRQNLHEHEADYTSRGLARGINTLAYIARDEKDKSAICEFLLGYVNHKKRLVQLGAIESLGTLGDPHALAALEKFALARRENPEQLAATRAIQNIENFRRPVEGIGELRKDFLDLQKENRELRKDFNALEKKFNAAGTKPDATKKGSPVLKSPKQKSAA
jgi:aminopeptidase N